MTMTKLIISDELDSAQVAITRLQDENMRLMRVIASVYETEAMTLSAYQAQAHATSKNTQIGGTGWTYPIIGLANESGELLGKVKKIFRDNDGILTDTVRLAMHAELGDILWYVAETASQLEIDLADLAALNLLKLASRANRGVIGGSGDKR
jgi:NTP pyrophosphatase (non-canonical NTP hydrolase)